MLHQEFHEKVLRLFKDLVIARTFNDSTTVPDFKLNDDYYLRIMDVRLFYVIGNDVKTERNVSSYFDNFEEFYDELIIFKELILPKYL